MNAILMQILMGMAQTALAAMGGYFVAHHWITGEQENTFIQWGLTHAAIYAPIAIALGLTLWNKYRGRVKMLVALQPGVHTEDQVNQIIKSGQLTPTILTPPSTQPGVPHPQVNPETPAPPVAPPPPVAQTTIHITGVKP